MGAVAVAPSGPVVKSSPQGTIRDLLERQKAQIELALPKHLTADRLMRVALTTINKNAKLQACTQTSLLGCIMDCAALGLEPDGRRAHLIPYGDKCTLIVDYKGLVELAMNAGDVSNIHADIICENDDFSYNKGVVETHKINFRSPRGGMYGVYCIITMKDGGTKSEVMTKDEVDAIRARSRSKNDGPWVTDYNEMAKKTVFRRASKWIKLSPELRDKVERDDEEIESTRFAAAKPVFTSEPVGFLKQEPAIIKDEPPTTTKAPILESIKAGWFAAFCQDQKIELQDLLNYLGEMGYPSFAEVPDQLFETFNKQPSALAKSIKV